jgi:type IV pilus assembly protein PilO
MTEKIIQLIDWSWQKKAAVSAVIFALIIGGYWYMFFSSVEERLATAQDKLSKYKAEISKRQLMVVNLPKFQAEVDLLDAELKKALAELPDKREIAQLLEKIADRAKSSGLDIRLFRPKGESKKDFYAEVPVEIEVGGGYHQVATFFDEVGALERIVNIDNFSMTTPVITDAGISLKTTLVATSFRFLDESERPKPENEKKNSKKKTAAKKSAKSDI